MAETPRQIAKRILPGWKVVRTGKADRAEAGSDTQTPSLDVLRQAYDLKPTRVGEGFAAASGAGDEAEFVVMEPPADQQRVGRKVVVVSNGRAIAVQG